MWPASPWPSAWPHGLPLRLTTLLGYTAKLIDRPVDGDQAAVQALRDAGFSVPAVVALAQLIAFVS